MLDLAKHSLLTAKKDFPLELIQQVETPCYLISEDKIEQNCKILHSIYVQTKAKVLLALKAFFLPSTFPLMAKYLQGVCASGLFEARAGKTYFQKEVHTFAPAYHPKELPEIAKYSTTIVFNSIFQLKKFSDLVKAVNPNLQLGLRINPNYSEVQVKLYDPCQPKSRFGVLAKDLSLDLLKNVDGLHLHVLCEQNSDVLARVIKRVEEQFEPYLRQVKWLNLGGGHHITRQGYDLDLLLELIYSLQTKYDLQIYLEPGEAVVLNAGVLVSQVMDLISNQGEVAILDTSAENHMPDVLAMPYRPQIIDAAEPYQLPYTYRLTGITCLAGDIIGDYSFANPLKRGQKLVFTDMALYSFVKNTTFNGINLPHLITFKNKTQITFKRTYTYEDFIRKYTVDL